MEALNSTFVDRGPGYLSYKLILFLALLIPITVLDILLIISTCLEKSVNLTIRLVMLNIPVSSLVMIAGFTADHIAAVHLTLARNPHSPPPQPCYLIVYSIGVGAAARLVFMALFAVTTFLIIKLGQSKIKPAILALTSLMLWVLLLLFNIPIAIPAVAGVNWDDGVSCRPFPQSETLTFAFIGIDIIVFGIVPFVLTIVLPIVTYCYIKQSVITEDLNTKKVLVKFTLFLILGNAISVLGLLAILLISTLSPRDTDPTVDAALVRTANIITHLSFIPAPILILFYFPAIRRRLQCILECVFCFVCQRAGYDYRAQCRLLCHCCKEKGHDSYGVSSKDVSTGSTNITK